uniref:Uncharacterized protein n=1 Tax=Cupriavidus necator TaxID=106590 RepID=Q9F180_CUPNE|nr:unknown [Cupriavidus necator]
MAAHESGKGPSQELDQWISGPALQGAPHVNRCPPFSMLRRLLHRMRAISPPRRLQAARRATTTPPYPWPSSRYPLAAAGRSRPTGCAPSGRGLPSAAGSTAGHPGSRRCPAPAPASPSTVPYSGAAAVRTPLPAPALLHAPPTTPAHTSPSPGSGTTAGVS